MRKLTILRKGWLVVTLLCLIISAGQASALPAEQQSELTLIAATTEGGLSIHLPEGWQFRTVANLQYSSLLAFGDFSASLQAMTASLAGETSASASNGSNGMVGVVSPALYVGLDIEVAAESIFQAVTSTQAGVEVISQKDEFFGDGQFQGWLALANSTLDDGKGYIAVFMDAGNIVVAIVGITPAEDFEDIEDEFLDMLQSIRVPAEADAAIETQTATPAAVSAAGTTVVSGGDDAFSLELPADWVFEDWTTGADVFAYGGSDVAVQSRLDSMNPDLTDAMPITGSGGVVILYNPADVGLEDSGGLSDLMNQVRDNLTSQGLRLVGETESIDLEGGSMLYAVVSGVENGYVGLAFAGGQVAFITATGDSQSFKTDREVLFAILQSLHIPAAGGNNNSVDEPTPTQDGSEPALPTATASPGDGGGRIVPAQTATPGQGAGRIVPVLPTPTP